MSEASLGGFKLCFQGSAGSKELAGFGEQGLTVHLLLLYPTHLEVSPLGAVSCSGQSQAWELLPFLHVSIT